MTAPARGTRSGSVVALTTLAGRVYANAVLRTGRRVALRDAMRGR